MIEHPERHAAAAVLHEYFDKQIAGVLGVPGAPPVSVGVDPQAERLIVTFSSDGPVPDVGGFANLEAHGSSDDTGPTIVLAVHLDENLDEVYAFLCSLIDRVQLDGAPVAAAVEQGLKSLAGILALKPFLSREKQVGLFGELLALLGLIEAFGETDAVASWRGPLTEEHDFGLPQFDLEVKSTLAERREHWISSLTQLVPSLNRDLMLLSIQLTSAAVGQGISLPALVQQLRARLSGDASHRFAQVLRRLGYRDEDAPLYGSRWAMRSAPTFFDVTPDFPAITPDTLSATLTAPSLVTDVRYRVSLGDWPASPERFSIPPISSESTT